MFINFFFGQFLVWLPWSFSLIILLSIGLRFVPNKLKFWQRFKKIPIFNIVILLVGATLFFDIFLTILQYITWSHSAFSKFLLPPYQPLTYYLRYSLYNIWLADIITLIPAGLIWLIFLMLKKYKPDSVKMEEISLILLLTLLLGWPKSLIFIPLFFLITLLSAVINILFFKRSQINFLPAIIIAAVIIFFLGNAFISQLGLTVLSL